METSDERRRRKLAVLCRREGGYKNVAKKANVSAPGLDQVLKGVLLPEKADGTRSAKSLGNKVVKAIEAAYPDLGAGWFDAPDTSKTHDHVVCESPDEDDLIMSFRKFPENIKQELVRDLMRLALDYHSAEGAAVFAKFGLQRAATAERVASQIDPAPALPLMHSRRRTDQQQPPRREQFIADDDDQKADGERGEK